MLLIAFLKILPRITRLGGFLILLAAFLVSCAAPSPTRVAEAAPTGQPVSSPTAAQSPTSSPTLALPTSTVLPSADDLPSCVLDPVVIPTLPAEIPGYTQLDSTTNLHVTGAYQIIDLAAYRLEVTGRVDRPLSLTYDDLRCLPRLEKKLLLVCPGFFEDEATWAGASLVHLLEQAGVHPEATRAELISADGYSTTLGLERVRKDHNFLAYEWEGQPLPLLHGFPLRAVFPDDPGARWVKWLVKIDIQ